jgi:DNA recombination protein RmuC
MDATMPDASLLALALSAASLVLLLILLLRRPPDARPDPAIPLLQAAQERQGERLGALSGELREAIALAREETGKAITGFALEQSKLLRDGLEAQRARLDEIEKALLARLAQDAQAAAARFEAHRAAQAEAAAAQRARLDEAEKALLERLAQEAQAAAARFEAHRAAQTEAAALLRRDLGAAATELKTGTETLRTIQTEAEARLRKAIADDMLTARDLIDRKAAEGRAEIEAKLKEMREANDARLADIQKTVNEQLQSAVEKQMGESFQRVIDQFDAVQRSMGEVKNVTDQIGNLQRLFSNVKTRGGWGEAQARTLLEDILPGGYVENFRPREDSGETVEFAVLMPSQRGTPLHLPLDAKFPVEDYERLLAAAEAGESEAERVARRALGERVKRQAQDISAKYIHEPATTDFGLLYLPSDSLYAEVARIPGLLAEIGRVHKVLVVGPSLLPAMLRTIQLGHYSLALSRNADAVRELLGATKTEIQKMDEVLTRLGKQAGTLGSSIEKAKVRTRAIGRKLRGVDAVTFERSEQVLEIEAEIEEEVEE